MYLLQTPQSAPIEQQTEPSETPAASNDDMDDLEKELEMDLENLDIDNIDTSVS